MAPVKAVIFGAIGVIAETSDIQRQSFNLAFREQGLDWEWNPQTYRRLLSINGGQARLRAYRAENPHRSNVSDAVITALHDRKTFHYATLTSNGTLMPRRGVRQTYQNVPKRRRKRCFMHIDIRGQCECHQSGFGRSSGFWCLCQHHHD